LPPKDLCILCFRQNAEVLRSAQDDKAKKCQGYWRGRITEKKENRLVFEPLPGAGLPAIEGALDATGKRFGIVVARFNAFITERLLLSAIDGLVRSGAKKKDIALVRVPGAFEIPLAARKLAETKKYDAIICLGCLLRGDTAHYDVIVNEVTHGVGQSAQETGVPHVFGVLTCETLEQAIDRAGLKMGNKGFEAALAAVEMASLAERIRRPASGVGESSAPRVSSAAGKQQVPRSARNDKPKKMNDKSKKQSGQRKVQSKRPPHK
jgi:6,7-dimethyl-8-ribityllumazine synthase